MDSRLLALWKDQLGGFSRCICHSSSCRSRGAGGGGLVGGDLGRGKNLSEENCVCAAQLPAQAGGTPQIRPDPGPSPAAIAPHVPWGRGRPEVLTSQEGSANRSRPSRAPRGFPGHSRNLGRDPTLTMPNLDLKEGRHLAGETEAGTSLRRGGTLSAAAQEPGSSRAQRGAGIDGSHTAGQRAREYRWVARRERAEFPFPAGARRRGLFQPHIISGSPKAFWSPPGLPRPPPTPGRSRAASG